MNELAYQQMQRRLPILLGINPDGSMNVQRSDGRITIVDRSGFPELKDGVVPIKKTPAPAEASLQELWM